MSSLIHEWLTGERPGQFYTVSVNVNSSKNKKHKGVQ
jgi:hypothetical protein